VLRVKVAVRDGEWLPHDYRLLQLTEQERWRRNAEAVLLDPESARDIALSAAILPAAATPRRWDAKVLVTLDPQSLGLLPSGERSVASWEIGAVLMRRGGRGGVEMLGVSRVDCPKAGCTTTIVHERVVEGLHPGSYELRAFAHDRWSNAYGGSRAEIELPAPREPAVIGPVFVASASRYFSSDLPLRSRKPKDNESRTDRASTGMLPLREGEEPAAALAWVCGDKKAESLPVTTARLWRGGTAVALAGEPTIERIGQCWSVQTALDSSGLSPGEYRYEFVLSAHGEIGAARGFEIPAPTPGPESKTVVLVAQADGSAGAPESDESLDGSATPEGSLEISTDPAITTTEQPASRPAVDPTARAGDLAIEAHPARGSRDLDQADIRVASPELSPSDVALEALLEDLARQAEVYRDSALRFTCDETVVEIHRGKHRTFEFEYTYAYDDAGRLQDHRMTRRIAERVRNGKALPEPVDLADFGLHAFVLRAYSSIFIFAREYRHLYEFEILGEEETLGRPAFKVRIAALPPHVDGLNQWFGAAWVDRDTHRLLRFRGLEVEDRVAKELYDKGVVQEGSRVHRRSHYFDEIDVEFGVRSGELRFPSRVVMERTKFETSWKASYLRTEAVRDLRTVQSYDNYRIFGVRSAETFERIFED
jgi:YD repeat-containing protein